MFFDARKFAELEETTPTQICSKATVKVTLPTKNVCVLNLPTYV